METVLAFITGILFAGGIYLLLRRSMSKVILGLLLVGHAVNLLIFTAAGLVRSRSPLIPPGSERLSPPYPDPLAQALILTAIVIGFGILAFALVLAYRTFAVTGTDDVDELQESAP
ncbi:MAG: Na+/H+ antiporter subunit C [Acidobacteria bacterium]|nr:Na+/H+ antiporter subunit C [Acidobacteriota bacterium]